MNFMRDCGNHEIGKSSSKQVQRKSMGTNEVRITMNKSDIGMED